MSKGRDFTKKSEGYSAKMYKCPAGYNTIGWGFNLDANEIPLEASQILFEASYSKAEREAKAVLGNAWEALGEARREAVTDMVFNLGLGGFKKFKKFILALGKQDWVVAGKEMQDSLWYRQVGERSKTLQYVIVNGKWP